MNKEFAVEILEMVEAKLLGKKSSLAKEAFSYLKRLKKIPIEIKNRIWRIENK